MHASLRWTLAIQRNLRVWRKLVIPSLLGNFGEPLIYLLALGYGLGRYIGSIDGLPYMIFLASGIVCSSAMNTATFEGLYSAYTRMQVHYTWQGMITAPLGVTDVVLGEVVWMGLKSLVSASAILLVASLLGLVPSPHAVWALPLFFIAGTCFGAMALIVTSLARGYDFFIYYFSLLIVPMTLLSGVFFPLESLPKIIQAAAYALPLSHLVALVRPLLVGQPLHHVMVHLAILFLYTLVAITIAIGQIRRRLID